MIDPENVDVVGVIVVAGGVLDGAEVGAASEDTSESVFRLAIKMELLLGLAIELVRDTVEPIF